MEKPKTPGQIKCEPQEDNKVQTFDPKEVSSIGSEVKLIKCEPKAGLGEIVEKAKLKIHQCDECKKTFTVLQNLKIHFDMVHNKLRPYQCKECSKCFASKNNAKRHIDFIHKNSKSHPCYDCGMTFSSKQNYQLHVCMVPTTLKPNQCKTH